jgi:hypothetical protein
MVVLVGGSSTGKTRACWEAIHAEQHGKKLLEGWRLWHPFDPTRPDAALDALDEVSPHTVVWLNETQFYLSTEGSDHGERVAARLRTLLTDPDRAPVIVLGTIWPEYWDILTRRPTAGATDPHAQARELLAGRSIVVAESFDQAVVDRLKKQEGQDPRLLEAATRAEDGELTQYLAGAPALLQRYDTAPPGPKALLTAAMDLRRLGHGPTIPIGLLEVIAPLYLTDRQWRQVCRTAEWFNTAAAYAEEPCHGAHSPLARVLPRPGQTAPDQPHYRLADYLEQTGRRRRRREILPFAVWPAIVSTTLNPSDAARLGHSADNRQLYCFATPLLGVAAKAGDINVARRLADLLVGRSDVRGLQGRADAGDTYAAERLIDLLAKQGDPDTLRIRANRGDRSSAERLAQLLIERGDVEAATALLRFRNPTALNNRSHAAAEWLANLAATGDDLDELQRRSDAGKEDNPEGFAVLLPKRGDLDKLQAEAAAGNTYAAWAAAELLFKRGDLDGLQARAEVGDRDAAQALADLLVKRGDIDALHARADAGDQDATARLIDLLVEKDDIEAAHRLGRVL